jgi:hypothetical protein
MLTIFDARAVGLPRVPFYQHTAVLIRTGDGHVLTGTGTFWPFSWPPSTAVSPHCAGRGGESEVYVAGMFEGCQER